MLKILMNIVFVTLDGARIDRILRSATMKNLMQQGTSFTNMITYAPYTIAAMHAIFSGEYGFKTGVDSYWSTFKFKKEQYKTLAQFLHDEGYQTFGDAINELILPPQGFDDLRIHDEDKDVLVERHKTLLDKVHNIASNGNKFFLYLHYSNIHTNIKNNVLKKYNNFSEDYFKNKPENEKNYDMYFKGAEIYLEEIMSYCTKLDMVKNTLFVIISDHGISVGDKWGERAYGAFCYDYTLKSFALFIKDGKIPVKTIDKQVRSIDIMPTLLDVLQISKDKSFNQINGKSLMPLINGDESEPRSAISETGNPLNDVQPPKEPNVISVRKNNWKLILNLHNNTREIYDLSKDPNEEINLIDKKLQIEKDLFEDLCNTHPRIGKSGN